jgi:zinc transporter
MAEHILFEGTGADGWQWTHMLRAPGTEAALLADPEIPNTAAWALLEEDTLPRASQIDGGTLLILRGVNLVPGADPEDMISLRLWITARRIVSTEVRRLAQTDHLIAAFRDGQAPESPDAFVLALVESLRAAAEPVLDMVEGKVSAMEAMVAWCAPRRAGSSASTRCARRRRPSAASPPTSTPCASGRSWWPRKSAWSRPSGPTTSC